MMTGQIQQGRWFAAWTAAQMITGTGDAPIDPHLRKNTIRQQIQPSIGGDRIRLTLSNEYGIMPAVFESVSIAYLIEPSRNGIESLTNTTIIFAGLQSVGLPAGETVTSETVVQLSKGAIQSKKIKVDLSLEELDASGFKKGATYEEIKQYVLEHMGLKVSCLYIAQVKQKCGIIERECYNKPKSENARQPQCSPEKEAAIRAALEHFRMI